MNFKKHFLLLIIFVFFALFLVFQESALAGCADQYYYTQCDDKVTIGRCCWGKDDGTCCSEHEECEETCDEEGNCTETCQDVCDSWCRECSCNRSWYEYSCGSSVNCICNNGDPQCCNGDIYRRKCYSKQEGNCSMGSCENESCHFDRCDPSELCEECQSWQKPIRGGCEGNCAKWGTEKPECKCCGECLEAPKNPKYCMSPSCSITAEANNVLLPVNLDWDDVPGWWGGGWSGGGSTIQEYAECQRGYIDFCWEKAKALNPGWRCQGEITEDYLVCLRRETKENCEEILEEDDACNKKCPALEEGEHECYDLDKFVKSYVITIEGDLRDCNGSNISSYTAVLGSSEFFAPCPCFFKSNRPYNWSVKACCGEDGTGCQEDPAKQLHASFTTSPAPEPIWPVDPDWAGPGKAENLPREAIEKLEWCEISDSFEWQGADGKKYKYYETTIEGKKYYSPLTYKLLIYYKEEEGSEDICHPNLEREGECRALILTPDEAAGERIPPFQFWDKNHTFFNKITPYGWKVAACKDISANYCTDYSQYWRFEAEAFTLDKPKLVSPPNDKETPVGLPVLISWSSPYGMSFVYEISDIGQGTTSSHNISFDWPQLKLDTLYSWRVKPCWDYEAKECETFWSDTFYFRTTGRPPKPETMKPEGENIPIPVNFEWESVPGAKSYIFKIQGDDLSKDITIEEPKISLDYPDLKQEKNYSWQVKTCAKKREEDCVKNQTCCGDWSNIKTFKTFKLTAPSNPSLEDGEEIFTYQMPMNLSWSLVPGARYYKYTINYTLKSPEEVDEECLAGTKTENIVSSPSDYLSLNCLGEYEWQVTACLDSACQETGEPSPIWHFRLVQGEPGGDGGGKLIFGGLVPCGRNIDNPNTPWNEREKCQIKHLFILLRNIVDFLFWKVAPLLLVLLAVATGVIFFFSIKMETTTPIAQVKSLWKAAGIGYAILFFAWNITSLILTLFGYRVGIFGPWWQINF